VNRNIVDKNCKVNYETNEDSFNFGFCFNGFGISSSLKNIKNFKKHIYKKIHESLNMNLLYSLSNYFRIYNLYPNEFNILGVNYFFTFYNKA
jgi:hypothetical protein